MLKSDIAPAYRGGDVLRTRHIPMVEIGQRAGNTQNAVKPLRAQFFRIGNAVEQACRQCPAPPAYKAPRRQDVH